MSQTINEIIAQRDKEKSRAAFLSVQLDESRHEAEERGLTILDFARLCGWTRADSLAGVSASMAVYRRLSEFQAMERGRAKEAARLRAEVAALTESEAKALAHAEQMEKERDAAARERDELFGYKCLAQGHAKQIDALTVRVHEVAKERNDARAQLTIKTQEFKDELHALTTENKRLLDEKEWADSPLKAERDKLAHELAFERAWTDRWRADVNGCAAALGLAGHPAEPGCLTAAAQRLVNRLAEEKREGDRIWADKHDGGKTIE